MYVHLLLAGFLTAGGLLFLGRSGGLGDGFLLGNDGTFALQNLLYDLLLFEEEGTDDAVAYAAGAARATISTSNTLAALRQLTVLARAQGRNAVQLDTTVTTLGDAGTLVDIQVSKFAT